MIRDIFLRLFNEFSIAKMENFSGHPLAVYIRNEIPKLFEERFGDYSNIIWHASPGQGQWADAPWIAAFNPLITESAMRGYYPVYLFTKSMNAVYISLNQGMTDLRNEFGHKQAKEILKNRAGILRSRLSPEYLDTFKDEVIDLQAGSSASRLAFYEPGHVFGV